MKTIKVRINKDVKNEWYDCFKGEILTVEPERTNRCGTYFYRLENQPSLFINSQHCEIIFNETPPKGGSGVFDNQNPFCEKGEFVIPKENNLFITQMKMLCEITKEFRLLAETIVKLKQ